MSPKRIGIDLGGTKIEGVLLDETGRELKRLRLPTPKDDYPATLDTVVRLVATLEDGGARTTVGVGTPGSFSRVTGFMKNCNSTWLNGQALKHDLEHHLGREIRLANDANCFALSEAVDGAGQGAGCVFGVILGTGVGGGVVIDGRVWNGPGGIAGEWGHNPLPAPTDDERPGPECYCGRHGCIETFLSGPGLEADYAAASGERVPARDLPPRAEAGDPEATKALDRYSRRLAKALAGVINILEPDVIVLGGGLSKLEFLYNRVPALWGEHVFSDRVETRLDRARYGNASGVRGAAWLWSDADAPD